MANGGLIGPVKVVATPSTTVHTFNSSGTFQKHNCTSTIPEIMVIGGGGAGGCGGGAAAGGGGAGGYRVATCVSLPTAALAVTVGAGGAGNGSSQLGSNGSNSVIACSLTSNGGGGGAGHYQDCGTREIGVNGASGGGGGKRVGRVTRW